MAIYWKPEACRLTVLPDRSITKGQKLVENVKIQKFKWDILGDFQTLCSRRKTQKRENEQRKISSGNGAATFKHTLL